MSKQLDHRWSSMVQNLKWTWGLFAFQSVKITEQKSTGPTMAVLSRQHAYWEQAIAFHPQTGELLANSGQ
eukprot:5318046-Pyramimonas_sp.AAC.1